MRVKEAIELLDSYIDPVDNDVIEAFRIVKAEIERKDEALKAVENLISESDGVTGLHLNGDVALWSDLRTGGRFEEWLSLFDQSLQTEEE